MREYYKYSTYIMQICKMTFKNIIDNINKSEWIQHADALRWTDRSVAKRVQFSSWQ
jgi:hypothetical protein